MQSIKSKSIYDSLCLPDEYLKFDLYILMREQPDEVE